MHCGFGGGGQAHTKVEGVLEFIHHVGCGGVRGFGGVGLGRQTH